jgi:hypothetical protein
VIAILVLAALVPGLKAQGAVSCSSAVWCSSDQWGNTTQFTPFTLYNNMWGAPAGTTQTIAANSASQWSVTANYPETGGVKSYPNASLDMTGKTLAGLGSCTSSFNVSVPSSGSWSSTYDLWVPSEVMIWMNKNGAVGPIAQAWDSSGNPIPAATNVNVGGHTWNVYRGGNNVVSLVRTTNTNAATVDILAILNWIADQGWISRTSGLGSFQMGFEITSAPGGLSFHMNSYSISCGGGGGSTPTRTRAVPTNTRAPATATRTRTPSGPTPTRTRTPVPTTRTNTPVAPTRTPTSGGGGGTCSPITATITAPFTQDGAGTFCWRSNNLGTYINSWNLNSLTVNGANYTNLYAFTNSLPAKAADGYWYISYNSSVAWGHFEAK